MDYFGNTSDDDLLALARQAGYLPEDKGLESQDQGPITQPSQVPESPPTVSAPSTPSVGSGYSTPTVSAGQSQSQSTRGFNASGYDAIDQKTGPGLQGDLRGADAAAMAKDRPVVQAYQDSRVGDVEAEKAQARAQVAGIHQEGEDALVMQRLQDEFGVEEAKANAAATAQSNQSKADYLAALNDFRASRVDPAQLWHNMTGGERFGTMMSAFVHDFLGARGINTSAMATLNKAIDRNIDAQVQAIHTKGDVAEGFKSLWYMQRSQSASDAEARARVRGFLLDGAKSAVIANMAPYKAALASAQGQAAIAKINDEFAKNLADIYKHIDGNAVALRQQAIDIWKEKVNAAIESRSVSVSERAETRAAAKDSKVQMPEVLNDPETGEPSWVIKPGIPDTEKTEIRNRLSAVDEVNYEINELRELVRNNPAAPDGLGGSRFQGTADQRFDAIATNLAHTRAKANGERATDADVEQFKLGLRKNTWFNQADAEKVLADTQKEILYAAHAGLKNRVIDLPAEMKEMFPKNPSRPFAGSATDAENTVNPPPPDPEVERVKSAVKGSADVLKDTEVHGDDLTGQVRSLHDELVKARPDLYTHKEAQETEIGDSRFGGAADYTPTKDVPNAPKRYEKTVADLMDEAQYGHSPAAKKQAVEALKRLAGPVIKDGMGTEDTEAFAAAIALMHIGEPIIPAGRPQD